MFFCIVLPSVSIAEEDKHCGVSNRSVGTEFLLSVSRSFHGATVFKLCKKQKQKFLVVINYFNEIESGKNKEVEDIVQLNSSDFDKLLLLRDEALMYNTRDYTMGLDGSTWCLDVQKSFTHTLGCFWSPLYNSEERGLKGMGELATYLWEYTEQSKSHGKLY